MKITSPLSTLAKILSVTVSIRDISWHCRSQVLKNKACSNPFCTRRWQNTLDTVCSMGFRKLVKEQGHLVANLDRKVTADGTSQLSWQEKLAASSVGHPRHACYACLLGKDYDKYAISETKFICLHSWKYRTGTNKRVKMVETGQNVKKCWFFHCRRVNTKRVWSPLAKMGHGSRGHGISLRGKK